MRILITNDDGIHAPGIKALEEAVREFSDDIWVVAPETPQSGVGHSISFHNPLLSIKHDERHFGVKGTPADSVIFALNGILKDKKPDLVLSGINQGANQSSDITCSGTISAAIEATVHGIKAIAFSQCGFKNTKWDTSKHFIKKMFKNLVAFEIPKDEFLSVNFPDALVDDVKGIKPAVQSIAKLRDLVGPIKHHFDFDYYWVGDLAFDKDLTGNYDYCLLNDKYVIVTPLKINLTSFNSITKLEKISW
ncbi:MAG: 5'-nucleotidase SurE [Alphaproteobacteria bacterium ADurb.Bin438]|nr:MAG: 5'-nucleotidase SurE [Alphaproteobacteria bacterium ADurb.Bin438]